MANRIVEEIDGKFYGNGLALASILRAKPSKITRLDQDGIISKEETEKGALYDIAESAESYFRSKFEDSEATKELQKARRVKEQAEASIKASKATIAKLEAMELQGRMYRVEDYKAVMEGRLYAIRTRLNALPGQLATDVAASNNPAECAVIIRTCINRLLIEMQKYRFNADEFDERVRERKSWEMKDDESDDIDE